MIDLPGCSRIGSPTGSCSFATERLDADRVLATDSWAWGDAPWGSPESFRLARDRLGSGVEEQFVDVLDLAPERVGVHARR